MAGGAHGYGVFSFGSVAVGVYSQDGGGECAGERGVELGRLVLRM